jgi:hypothetical protein
MVESFLNNEFKRSPEEDVLAYSAVDPKISACFLVEVRKNKENSVRITVFQAST